MPLFPPPGNAPHLDNHVNDIKVALAQIAVVGSVGSRSLARWQGVLVGIAMIHKRQQLDRQHVVCIWTRVGQMRVSAKNKIDARKERKQLLNGERVHAQRKGARSL